MRGLYYKTNFIPLSTFSFLFPAPYVSVLSAAGPPLLP